MGEVLERPRLIASPVFAGSVGLLLLNDHVLKQAWPGLVTGKLSDVAGVVMAAIALTALLRVRAVSFVLVAVAFTLLKTVPAVADVAAIVLGGRTLTDPTDLLALGALVPLWTWLSARGWSTAARPVASSSSPRRPLWVVPVQIAALGVAVVATTGSSCGPDGLYDVRAIDGIVYARAGTDVWVSDDGGGTWHPSDIDPFDPRFDPGPDEPVCVGDRCFDVVGSFWGDEDLSVVESTPDGPVVLLALSPADRSAFEQRIDPYCGLSMMNGVAAVQVGDDVHLVVDMGEAGVLHRGVDERWEWVAVGPWGLDGGDVTFLGHAVASGPERSWYASAWLARSLLVGAPVLAFAGAVGVTVLAARRGRSAIAAALLGALLGLAVLAPSLLFLMFLSETPVDRLGSSVGMGAFLVLVAAGGLALLAGWFGRSVRPIADEPAWPPPGP